MQNISLFCTLMLLCFITQVNSSLTVDPVSNLLKDEHDRVRIMHGINVVYKQFPYYPTRTQFNTKDSLVKQDFENLKNWGFNSIRLYMAWQGFEPKRKQYNYTYLDILRDIVRQADQYGISVIIDAHHDVYSKKFCGEGFPSWLVQDFSFPAPFKIKLRRDSQGNPLKEDCMKMAFVKYYFTYDVVSFSHDFFTNKDGMNDKFIEMWAKVMEYFKSEDNVIGYDILNEPTGGNFWKNPYSLIGPDQTNNRFLLPFYKKFSLELRKIQPNKLFMFQPFPLDMVGGFYQPFSNYSSKDLLNYHTYCPFGNKLGSPLCNQYHKIYMKRRQQNIKQLGVGGILSQFGSVFESPSDLAEIRNALRVADKYQLSWYYWQFKYNMDSTSTTNPPELQSFYYPNGTLQLKKVKALSYSYVYALCGKYINQTVSEGSYFLNFFPKKCRNNKTTELFLNEQFDFQNGFVVSFKPSCEKCRLRRISKSHYELIVDESFLGKALTVGIGAIIG